MGPLGCEPGSTVTGMSIEIAYMHSLQDACMHAKLSLTSAYAKLGLYIPKIIIQTYMTIELSQLMINLYVLSSPRSFSRSAVDMHSLCEY